MSNASTQHLLAQRPFLLTLAVLFLPCLLYWEVQYYEFIGLDDRIYITSNPVVVEGLTWNGIHEAFTKPLASNYHPITWISLMVDSSLFGLSPYAFHRTSVLVHLLNVLLVFVVLRRVTKNPLPSAFVAALFAVHPLLVEPVAWVASRKDVLSGLFWWLGLWAYCAIPSKRRVLRIGLTSVAFALTMLSKPSMIAFPFVLLLLDYWPLKHYGEPPQFSVKKSLRLILEKSPMFAMIPFFLWLIVTAASSTGSLSSSAEVSLFNRAMDTIVNYGLYIGKFIVPIRLSPQYAYQFAPQPWTAVAVAALVLCVVSTAAFIFRRNHPHLLVGWLWFLGVMFPLSGLMIIVSHNRADRYMYIPIIGLAIIVAWGVPALASRIRRSGKGLLAIPGVACVLIYAILSWFQVAHWRDEKAIALHMIEAQEGNPMGYLLLGTAYEREGDAVNAAKTYHTTIEVEPRNVRAHVRLGNLYLRNRQLEPAEILFTRALKLTPIHPDAYVGLALIDLERGNTGAARERLQSALEIRPGYHRALQILAGMNQ